MPNTLTSKKKRDEVEVFKLTLTPVYSQNIFLHMENPRNTLVPTVGELYVTLLPFHFNTACQGDFLSVARLLHVNRFPHIC